MTIQTLVAAMHQTDHSLLEKMNIQTDAIVVNQCDRDEIERFEFRGHSILWLSLRERGVGLSRNTALMRANADIVIFADEDVCYCDGYPDLIEKGFCENTAADILLFDLETEGGRAEARRIKHNGKVRLLNSLRYGAVHFACKREPLFEAGLSFHLLFGGGARYSYGEDSIFLSNALHKHLRVWTCSVCIGVIHQGSASSWFAGYHEKYFYDKGVLMKTAFGVCAYPLTVLLILKNRKQTKELGMGRAILSALKGIRAH